MEDRGRGRSGVALRCARAFGRLAFAAILTSCGGGSPFTPTPAPSPTPSPSPVSVHPVRGLVFYDENGNGLLDREEAVRLPGVRVTIGGVSAASANEGAFLVTGVPAGPRPAQVEAASLPPFFQPGAPVSLTVPPPAGFELAVPVALPIRGNRPNVYLAFGDSITIGDGSRGRRGYRDELSSRLRSYWGRADLVNDGVESTKSDAGAARLPESLARVRPAYALILYGTNDWNTFGCRQICFTIDSLRSMIRTSRAAGTVPVVSTVIPANPNAGGLAEARNDWVALTNTVIRRMVPEEGGVLADPHALFLAEGPDLSALFSDHVHPNDRGYSLIAEAFFRAVTGATGG